MDPVSLNYASKAMYLVLILSLPPIMVASVVGVGLSLFQAITQLQEQTLSFGVKLIVVSITMFICAPWITSELLNFAQDIFGNAHLF